jgi:hypothetical protein
MNDFITIPLSKTGKHAGKYEALVSIEDADLANFNWSVMQDKYAHRKILIDGHFVKPRLHRVIMERMLGYPIPDGIEVDHINRNGFDCRRENLRLATRAQNAVNRRKQSNNKSGYKGVSWSKSMNKWIAQIGFERKRQVLGFFDTPEAAHQAYCEASDKLHKEYGSHS